MSRSTVPNIKVNRYKGNKRNYPSIPNQPSEASAHFMFELAKNVLTKAGKKGRIFFETFIAYLCYDHLHQVLAYRALFQLSMIIHAVLIGK